MLRLIIIFSPKNCNYQENFQYAGSRQHMNGGSCAGSCSDRIDANVTKQNTVTG